MLDPTTPTRDALLLAAARECRRAADAAEAQLLIVAGDWADTHRFGASAESGWFDDTAVALAGPGTELISEFSVAEFAACLGLSTDAGAALLGEALELRDRLPCLWARVQAGDLPAWRARRVARHTMVLSREAAGLCDQQLAPYAHRAGPAQIDRLVSELMARCQPAEAEALAREAAEARHVTLSWDRCSLDGTVRLDAELGLADGHDLEQALQRRAADLAELGCVENLDVRRSIALGELARRQLALPLLVGSSPAGGDHELAPPGGRARSAHLVTLHVHLSDAAFAEPAGSDRLSLARVEEHQQTLTAGALRDQLCTWVDRAELTIKIVPVVDLNRRIAVDSYEIPDRLRRQIGLRDHTCRFPWCARPAASCDVDHVVPYDPAGPPGQTNTDNLAALCRRHHRLKTHGGWTYRAHADGSKPGGFQWRAPSGAIYLRDHTGTRALS